VISIMCSWVSIVEPSNGEVAINRREMDGKQLTYASSGKQLTETHSC
jgi:hypothetical protein